jgi:branched-chain amino acid transport system ATP-binding protein
MMPFLRTENLTKRFGGLTALDQVNLSIDRQEILGIIGPNGAGKTTLFNVISGLFNPTAGRIWYDGQYIEDMKPNQVAAFGIARTFQIVRPFRDLSVIKNVLPALGAKFCRTFISSLRLFNKDNFVQEARDLLNQVELGKYEHDLAKNLPLGLLRRLEIARALAISPSLILLDESFSGLSHQEISSQIDLVRRLRTEGKTVILIEHNMEVAMDICDHIVVLEYGRKIAEGLPMEIQNDPLVIKAYLGEEEQIA